MCTQDVSKVRILRDTVEVAVLLTLVQDLMKCYFLHFQLVKHFFKAIRLHLAVG